MYIDGFILAVPTANKEAYRAHAEACNPIFRDYGVLRQVECWGDEVPDGAVTSLPMAVQRKDDETVVFAWLEWPDKATRDAGMARMQTDPRFAALGHLPFDRKRMIFGGFVPVVDL